MGGWYSLRTRYFLSQVTLKPLLTLGNCWSLKGHEGGGNGSLPVCVFTSPLCSPCLSQVDKTASGLLSIGLSRGDRLGMWGPNSYAWVLMQLATAQAGIILVR